MGFLKGKAEVNMNKNCFVLFLGLALGVMSVFGCGSGGGNRKPPVCNYRTCQVVYRGWESDENVRPNSCKVLYNRAYVNWQTHSRHGGCPGNQQCHARHQSKTVCKFSTLPITLRYLFQLCLTPF